MYILCINTVFPHAHTHTLFSVRSYAPAKYAKAFWTNVQSWLQLDAQKYSKSPLCPGDIARTQEKPSHLHCTYRQFMTRHRSSTDKSLLTSYHILVLPATSCSIRNSGKNSRILQLIPKAQRQPPEIQNHKPLSLERPQH